MKLSIQKHKLYWRLYARIAHFGNKFNYSMTNKILGYGMWATFKSPYIFTNDLTRRESPMFFRIIIDTILNELKNYEL
jgi:hypothetical protein